MTNEELLNAYQSKARCLYTQDKANKAQEELYNRGAISRKHYGLMSSAMGHYRLGEGAWEIDHWCQEIREEWRKLNEPT
jgi:hypothetical protein